MVEERDRNLYRNFSRKDLQLLCKKYGLPANKSNSEMATALILYLEKKNLPSLAKGTKKKTCPSSSQLMLRTGRTTDACHQEVQQRDSMNCTGAATSDKEVRTGPQLQHPSGNVAACRPHNAFSSAQSCDEAPAPTFQFEVSCEDGIQLCVDFDSSTSDWVNSMKSGIEICPTLHSDMPQSLQQDCDQVGCSKRNSFQSNMNQNQEISDNQVTYKSKSNFTMKENGRVETDNGREVLILASAPERCSNNLDMLVDLGQDQLNSSSRTVSDSGQDQLVSSSRNASDLENSVDSGQDLLTLSSRSVSEAKKDSVYRMVTWQIDEPVCTLPTLYNENQFQSSRQLGSWSSLDSLRCSQVSEQQNMSGFLSPLSTRKHLPVARPHNRDLCYFASRNVCSTKCMDQVQEIGRTNSFAHPIEGLPCSYSMYSGSRDRVHLKCSTKTGHSGSLALNKGDMDSINFEAGSTNALGKERRVTPGIRHRSSYITNHVQSVGRDPGGLMSSSLVDQNTTALQVSILGGKDKSPYYVNAWNTGSDALKRSSETEQIALFRSNELNEAISKKYSTILSGKQDVSNDSNEREISEYNSRLMENPCPMYVEIVYNEGLKRKRELDNVNDQNKLVCHDASILRGPNHITREFNTGPRRLAQFYSK